MTIWITTENTDYVCTLIDKGGWWKVSVKWEGCVNIWRYYNVSLPNRAAGQEYDEPDYIHICDVSDLRMLADAIELVQKEKGFPR